MDKEFFKRKINELTDEKLRDLLRLNNAVNRDIIQLATEEAKTRNIEIENVKEESPFSMEVDQGNNKLRKWNWAAFLLSPIWTLTNNLERWTIVCFIPPVKFNSNFLFRFKWQ